MKIEKYIRYKFITAKRFFVYRILHADDTPYSIAMGVAIGIFLAWTPPIGQHMLVAVFLAALFGANKFIAFSCVWVSNPFTFIPIYYPNFLVGRKLLELFRGTKAHVSAKQLWQQLTVTTQAGDFWKSLLRLFWHFALPELWLGSVVMGLIVAVICYFLTYKLVVRHRKANPHLQFRSNL